MNQNVTAQEWFALGKRVPYDFDAKTILKENAAASPNAVDVFQRVVKSDSQDSETQWTTFLPGFPDGSFGWAKVDRHLGRERQSPMLFVEYVGQGDSDKPADYTYGTMESADLVEAMWQAEGIKSTFIVSFDYSSLVVHELLSRRLERPDEYSEIHTSIEGVLLINGGLFADSHSHPLMTTPVLRSPLGAPITWVAQRSRFVLKQMLKPMFSKEYNVTSDEMNEIAEAISRRNGVSFLSWAAGFRYEHQTRYAERWDLRRLYLTLKDSVSFHVVGSEGDQFEPNQIVRSRERLGNYGLDIRMVPGGHMTTSEQPEMIARMVQEFGPQRSQN